MVASTVFGWRSVPLLASRLMPDPGVRALKVVWVRPDAAGEAALACSPLDQWTVPFADLELAHCNKGLAVRAQRADR